MANVRRLVPLLLVLPTLSWGAPTMASKAWRQRRPGVTVRFSGTAEGHPPRVSVHRNKAEPHGYMVTDRTLEHLTGEAPPSFFDLAALRGKKVLDTGAGGGQLVKDLRRQGIKAVGVDLVLDERTSAPHLMRGDVTSWRDMRRVLRRAGPFDVIYSNYSIFHYSEPMSTRRAALKQFRRLLKPGGVVRIVGINTMYKQTVELVSRMPGLEVTYGHPFGGRQQGVLEIKRTR